MIFSISLLSGSSVKTNF